MIKSITSKDTSSSKISDCNITQSFKNTESSPKIQDKDSKPNKMKIELKELKNSCPYVKLKNNEKDNNQQLNKGNKKGIQTLYKNQQSDHSHFNLKAPDIEDNETNKTQTDFVIVDDSAGTILRFLSFTFYIDF